MMIVISKLILRSLFNLEFMRWTMEFDRLENVGSIIGELEEIRKFESNTELEEFVSLSELCTPLLTILCC